jgi:hypothetical protein
MATGRRPEHRLSWCRAYTLGGGSFKQQCAAKFAAIRDVSCSELLRVLRQTAAFSAVMLDTLTL